MSDFNDDMETLQSAVQLFAQTVKRPQQWTRILQRANVAIDRPAAHILQAVAHNEPHLLGVQEVATRLSIEPPSVTRKTQELESAGYLLRIPNPEDRRAVGLQITPAGREVAERLRIAGRESMAEALKQWPEDERTQFVTLFERFSQDLALSSQTNK